jgi:hypothetical protein
VAAAVDVVTARLAVRVTVALAATMTAAGLVAAGPATATGTVAVPDVSLTGTSADVTTSSVLDPTHQAATDTPGRDFLAFSDSEAPPAVSIGQTSAVGTASQVASIDTSSAQPFPVEGINSISVQGSSSTVVTATPGDPTVPVATAGGQFGAEFATSGSVPVLFSGTLQTTNADPNDSCTFAEVTITGPVSRTFDARTGSTCTTGTTSTRQWTQSISLPAGAYRLDVTYSSSVDDQRADNEPASLASATGVSVGLVFFPPTAAFTTSLSGSVAVFDASTSAPGAAERPLTTWLWDFGDGSRAVTSRPVIKHTFPTSPSTAPTYRVTLQVVDSGQGRSTVVSHAVVGTTVAFTVSKSSSNVRVTGSVRPARAGHRVVVTLARKVGGSFSTLTTRRPTLSARSLFASSMSRPRAGTCRVRVRYPGDATHLAGLSQRIFSC